MHRSRPDVKSYIQKEGILRFYGSSGVIGPLLDNAQGVLHPIVLPNLHGKKIRVSVEVLEGEDETKPTLMPDFEEVAEQTLEEWQACIPPIKPDLSKGVLAAELALAYEVGHTSAIDEAVAVIERQQKKWREMYEEGDMNTIVVGEMGRCKSRIRSLKR